MRQNTKESNLQGMVGGSSVKSPIMEPCFGSKMKILVNY